MYETSGGQPIIEEFIRSLQPDTQAKCIRILELLEEFGPELSMPHTKPLGNGLYELRVRGRQEVRMFYVFSVGTVLYIVHAFLKKTQVTPKKELDLVRQRLLQIQRSS